MLKSLFISIISNLGGVFRKTFLASSFMIGSASICYPKQAVDISQNSWNISKNQIQNFYRQNFTGKVDNLGNRNTIVMFMAFKDSSFAQ